MLKEEYNRMAFLLNYKSLNESEEQEIEDKAIEKEIDKEAKELGQVDYKGTNERKELPFPMKYATIASDISYQTFLSDMEYLFLELSKKGKSAKEIVSILAPHISISNANDSFLKFIELLEKYNKIQYVPKEELEKYGNEAKKRFLEFPSGDEKNIISYRFGANPNKLKLTPTGFWQLQFLARTAVGDYAYPEDEVFIISKNKEIYRGNALKILKNFYTAVFKKMIPSITGRFHLEKEYRDIDVDQQIMLEVAVDHFIEGLFSGKYNTDSNNIGAWAIQVMKNKVKETIRSFTDMAYRTGIDTKTNITAFDAFQQNKWDKWDSKLSPENLSSDINELVSSYRKKSDDTYTYIFKSPEDAFEAFESASKIKKDDPKSSNPFLIKYLPSYEQKRLKDSGLLLSIRRDVGFTGDEGEEIKEVPITKTQKDSEYIKLYRLFDKLGVSMGDTKILNASSDNDAEFTLLRNTLRSAGLIDDSGEGRAKILDKSKYDFLLERGFGEAIYHTLQNIAWDYPIWAVKPSKNFIDSLREKYKKDFSEPKTGSPIGGTYLDDKGKILPEIEDFVKYETSTIRGGRENMIKDFVNGQNEKNRKGEPSFYPSKDVFSKISQKVDQIRGSEGKGGFLKGKDREDFNSILTNLTGKEIFRESEKIKEIRKMIFNILKENNFKF